MVALKTPTGAMQTNFVKYHGCPVALVPQGFSKIPWLLVIGVNGKPQKAEPVTMSKCKMVFEAAKYHGRLHAITTKP